MDVKWNVQQTIIFFDIYRKYNCLWDTTAVSYLKRDLKLKAYENMVQELKAEGMNITVSQLRNKIKSLRDTYRIEINKIKKSINGGAAIEEVYKPKLGWFPTADAFLRTTIMGNFSSNLDLESSQSQIELAEAQEESNESLNSQVSEVRTRTSISRSFAQNQKKLIPTKFIAKKKSPNKVATPSSRVTKKYKRDPKIFTESTVGKLQTQLATYVPEDQYDTFGKHIASQLRQLPLRSFINVQSQIQNIITEERLSCLDEVPSTSNNIYDSRTSMPITPGDAEFILSQPHIKIEDVSEHIYM